MTDDELVVLLGMVWGSISEVGGTLTEAEWKSATECPGWSVQDNLTHITAFEWRLLGRPDPDHVVAGDLPHVKNDIGKSNEVFVDSRRTWTGEAALTEFDEVIAARLTQLRDATPDDFAAETWTPAGPGQVRDLLPFRIFDSWVHEQDMRRAVGRPGDLDTPVAAAALERITGALPFVVGKKAGAPDGATVVFELTGPLARRVAIGVDGGRAKIVAGVPASPSATIATDTETLSRLGTGRVAPEQALADGRVVVDGDVDLGRRVVENLNFLF